MKKLMTLGMLCGLAVATTSQAQQAKRKTLKKTQTTKAMPESSTKKPNKKHGLEAQLRTGAYGTAGCGLGSIVFGEQPGKIQIVAATLNWFGMQTSGITTGTSNCVNNASSAQATEIFIDTNKETIKKEIARGTGENLEALSQLLGCSDAQLLGEGLQRNFEHVFQSDSSPEVHMRIERSIRSDIKLAQSCARVG